MAEKDIILMHVRREDSGVTANDYTVLYPKTLERLVVDENGITLKDKMNTKLDKVLYTPEDILTKIKIVDGEGSGLDADTVDGLHAASFLPKIGTSIPAGADLDNYVTIGEYYCANNTVAAEVVHSPYPWFFYLEIRYIGIDSLVMQRWTSCNGSTMAIRYRKNLESYEWTDWAEYRAQTSGTWTPYLLANNVQI